MLHQLQRWKWLSIQDAMKLIIVKVFSPGKKNPVWQQWQNSVVLKLESALG